MTPILLTISLLSCLYYTIYYTVNILFLQPLVNDELLFMIKNIAKQTGISPPDLFLKWVLQEEFFIGVVLNNGKKRRQKSAEAYPNVSESAEAEIVPPAPGNPEYRKKLVTRIKKLKKDGMKPNKIAKTFNEEKVPTVSGKGKWYASSIHNLL